VGKIKREEDSKGNQIRFEEKSFGTKGTKEGEKE